MQFPRAQTSSVKMESPWRILESEPPRRNACAIQEPVPVQSEALHLALPREPRLKLVLLADEPSWLLIQSYRGPLLCHRNLESCIAHKPPEIKAAAST